MNAPVPSPYDPAVDPLRAAPQVFARAVQTPSGFPWDQHRAAELEARMGAPAPISELRYRIVRLEPWTFGQSGRYAALYVRSADMVEGLQVEAEVDGRTVKAVFASPEVQARQMRSRVIYLVGALVISLVVAGALISALAVRADREERLDALEQRTGRVDAQIARLARDKSDARLLQASALGSGRLSEALTDLDWAGKTKAPEAHLQSLHWERGLMTLTTRGPAPPFTASDREVRKAERPVGKWLWLWGVGRPGSASAGGGAETDGQGAAQAGSTHVASAQTDGTAR